MRDEINKTEAKLQEHPAREQMNSAETRGKAMREQADEVQSHTQADNAAHTPIRDMHIHLLRAT